MQVLAHLLRRLHRRTHAHVLFDLTRTRLAPRLDHVAGHLDMALHSDVLCTQDERLICTVRARPQAHGALRNTERLAVPVIRQESRGGPPARASRVVHHVDLTPADLLDRVAGHARAQCLRQELPSETVTDHRDIGIDTFAYQREHSRNPGQIVVDTHRSAHHGKARDVTRLRQGIALVKPDYAPAHLTCR